MDDENNERAQACQATALVGCLNQQLAYQLACRQETRYQEILAQVDQESSQQEPLLVDCQTEENESCQQSPCDQAVNLVEADEASADSIGSFSPSTSNSPYITPPESPSKLMQNPFSSLFATRETQTVTIETLSTSAAVTQTEDSLYQEMVDEGCQSVPLTLEVAIGTPFVCVQDNSVNTELSAFGLLQVVHDAENSQRVREEHKLAMGELNEEKSKRLVSEQLVNIIQSDLMAIRRQNISETTARLRLEKEVADLKVHKISVTCITINLYVYIAARMLRKLVT